MATWLSAQNDYRGIALLAVAVPLYLGAVPLAAQLTGQADLALLVTLKLQVQLGLALLMLSLAAFRSVPKRPAPVPAPMPG